MRFYYKQAVLIVATILLIVATARADAALQQWNTTVTLEEDNVATFDVTFGYNETVKDHEYFVKADVNDVNVYADGQIRYCVVAKKDIGTTIKCNDVFAKNIRYVFKTRDVIDFVNNNLKTFNYRFSISRITDSFYVVVKLPIGHTIVADDRLQGTGLKAYEPAFGQSGSDGRRIFISWFLDKPQLGDALNASIIYEKTSIGFDLWIIVGIAIIVIAAGIGFSLVFRKKAHKDQIKDALPVLNEKERKILQILLQEGKEVDQRRIVKETLFSKSKVSRAIKELANRGLVEIVKRGRTNKVKMLSKQENIDKITKIEEKKSVESEENKKQTLPYTPEKPQYTPKEDENNASDKKE